MRDVQDPNEKMIVDNYIKIDEDEENLLNEDDFAADDLED